MKLPKLIGNAPKTAVLVFLFIFILCLLAWRCSHAAEIVARGGASVGHGGAAPALGLDLRFPQGNDLTLYAGTILWGQTSLTPTNWSWQAGFEVCRWTVCARLGAAYLQRIDAVNGSHTNFNLGISYQLPWGRFPRIGGDHLSNAGTSAVNLGRNAVLMDLRLQ